MASESEMEQYGEEVMRMQPPRHNDVEDLADEYSIRICPRADSGIIVFGKYRGEWHANPSLRPVVAEFLRRLGFSIPPRS